MLLNRLRRLRRQSEAVATTPAAARPRAFEGSTANRLCDDTWHDIITFLDAPSTCRLERTCRRLRQLANHEAHWQQLCLNPQLEPLLGKGLPPPAAPGAMIAGKAVWHAQRQAVESEYSRVTQKLTRVERQRRDLLLSLNHSEVSLGGGLGWYIDLPMVHQHVGQQLRHLQESAALLREKKQALVQTGMILRPPSLWKRTIAKFFGL